MPVSEGIAAAVTLKTTPGLLKKVAVIVAGTAGTINDCASTGAVASSNGIAGTPAVIGNQSFDTGPRGGLPFGTGLTVSPGAGQTVTVEWE